MSVYDIIIHATRNRIYMLEKMMDLIAEQIMYLENNKKLLNQLLLEYNDNADVSIELNTS